VVNDATKMVNDAFNKIKKRGALTERAIQNLNLWCCVTQFQTVKRTKIQDNSRFDIPDFNLEPQL
jgi:hypothetical protein